MMREEMKLSLLRAVYYFGVLLFVVCGLVFTLSSCDKEALGDTPVGELVPISINFLGISEGNVENLSRSAATESVTETVVLDDGMLMEMSLEPDPVAELRAVSVLADNVKFLLIAVKAADDHYVSHAVYTMTGGIPALDAPGDSVHVPSGGNYRFICVSLNSSTSPELYTHGTLLEGVVPSFANIPGTADLLYWRSDAITVTSRRVLPVAFNHWFSRIYLKVSAQYNGWRISNVDGSKFKFALRGSVASLSHDGTVSGSTTADGPNSTWPASGTVVDTVRTSDPLVYYMDAVSEPRLIVNAGAVSFENRPSFPSANIAADDRPRFPVLAGGKSYILRVKLKIPKFANSNIYWDDTAQKLTFDAHIDSVANSGDYIARKHEQRKQGVLFKWGSLIGISAPGRADTLSYIWKDSASIYVPEIPANPKTNHAAWTKTTVTAAQFAWSSLWGSGYLGIPYAMGDDYAAYGSGQNNMYLSLMPDSTGFYKGDICHYLNENYRMPCSKELGIVPAAWASNTPNTYVATDIYGQSFLDANRCATLKVNGMLFPASGNYLMSNGGLYHIGYSGSYWSSSTDNEKGYCLYFAANSVTASGNGGRTGGFSVRCVLKE
jgi:hypothetical protein